MTAAPAFGEDRPGTHGSDDEYITSLFVTMLDTVVALNLPAKQRLALLKVVSETHSAILTASADEVADLMGQLNEELNDATTTANRLRAVRDGERTIPWENLKQELAL